MRAGEVMRLLKINRQTLHRWVRTKDKDGNHIEPKLRYSVTGAGQYNYNDEDVYLMLGYEHKPATDVVIYARVSQPKNRDKLDLQIEKLTNFAMNMGLPITRVYSEISNGHDYDRISRKGLHSLVHDVLCRRIKTVIVESPDRISTFNAGWFEHLLSYYKVKIIYANASPVNPMYKEEVVKDVMAAVEKIKRMYNGRMTEGGKSIGLYDSSGRLEKIEDSMLM
jgi:putative resolvase